MFTSLASNVENFILFSL